MDTSVNWKIEWWRLERMNRLRKSWKKYFSTWARKCLVIDEVWNWTSTWQFWSNDSRRLAQCRSVMFLHNCVKNSGKYLKGWEEDEEGGSLIEKLYFNAAKNQIQFSSKDKYRKHSGNFPSTFTTYLIILHPLYSRTIELKQLVNN